tara:strand:- start:47476 stop:47700 length:225 start_codon:yes stop_codon:yes gene_type:complete
LKSNKHIPNIFYLTQFVYRIADAVIFQLDQLREFFEVELTDATFDVMAEYNWHQLAVFVIIFRATVWIMSVARV